MFDLVSEMENLVFDGVNFDKLNFLEPFLLLIGDSHLFGEILVFPLVKLGEGLERLDFFVDLGLEVLNGG